MKSTNSLQPGKYYHLYNRGNNSEDLFREERNYRYFLELYAHHIQPVADTFAYCLMRNHFHLLIRVKTSQARSAETCEVSMPASQSFSNLFNAYSKAINKAYGRTGSLFQDRFHRIEVTTDQYFTNLVYYIHSNPQKHGFVANFRDWSFSSYHAMLTTQHTRVQRDEVLTWFGGDKSFVQAHLQGLPEQNIAALVEDDFS